MPDAPEQSLHGDPDALNDRREQFIRNVPWGERVLDRLARDQIELTHVRRGNADWVWYLRVRLPGQLQEGFGIAPEVLLLLIRGELQGRDLDRARAELYKSGFRLDLDLLVVLDERPNLDSRLERMPGRWGQWIPWPLYADAQIGLADQLKKYLPTFDVFAKQDPVRGREVFGRAGEISEITTRVERGESVGVFGLRKVGKTTVVRAVTDLLDPVSLRLSFNQAPQGDEITEARARVAWLDVQRVFDRSRRRFLHLLAEAVQRRFQADKLPLPKLPPDPLDRLDRLCATVADSPIPLCLVLDEYDFLFEGEGHEPAIAGVPELLRLLRGWAQETKRLSIVVIGRDPQFFERSHMGGFPNPMLGWFVSKWLGPIPAEKATELIRKLGRRVGLEVGHRTTAQALLLTSGHPLLHRQYGSTLLQMASGLRVGGEKVYTDTYFEGAAEPFYQRGAVRDVCNDILHLLSVHYRGAYDLLQDLTSKTPAESFAVHAWNSPGAAVLRNFGILSGTAEVPTLPSALVQYTRSYQAPPPKPHGPLGPLPTGGSRRRRRRRRKGGHRGGGGAVPPTGAKNDGE